MPELNREMPEAFEDLFFPNRYKIFWGGRGGAKSWSFARALVLVSLQSIELILCAREFQSSLSDSVYRLIADQITEMDLSRYFRLTQNKIVCVNGSEFIFKGLQRNIQEIKSTEGITKVWVEEAQSVSQDSWEVLIPTIRKDGSEIWASFNTGEVTDPTYVRFVLNPPPNSITKKVSYRDNPYFPATLESERVYLKRVDPEAYEHVWEGEPRSISNACIFRGKYTVEGFETPEGTPDDPIRFYYGADWGFSQDPTALMRCFIRGRKLYIDQEAYGVGVELDEIPELFDSVPGSRDWPIRADDSRPETISYVKKKDSTSNQHLNPGSMMTPKQIQKDQSKKESHICASLKKSSFMNDVSTWPTKQNSIHTRWIN